MIKLHNFKEACQQYKLHHIPFRLLQEQAAVILSIDDNPSLAVSNPNNITQRDIAWLLTLEEESSQHYDALMGGYVYICETAHDLLEIKGYDLEWAEAHDGCWPNVTDKPMSWDVCAYLEEQTSDPQWVMFLLCWNNAGGPVYFVPKHLWVQARVTAHIEATNHTVQ